MLSVRDRTFIRIVAHAEQEIAVPQCEKLHQVLLKNSVQHEFCVLTNVKGHNPVECVNTLGDAAFSFFSPRSRVPMKNIAIISISLVCILALVASRSSSADAEPPIDPVRAR
jgi:hypothetical protein